MPQSLSAIYLHIIFSTKNRIPFLRDTALRNSLHAYLGSISKQIDCQPILTGGVADHRPRPDDTFPTATTADLVKELKRVSTNWLKQQPAPTAHSPLADFQWQSGYAAFSVSQSNLPQVKTYIANQEEHHATKSFQDELLAFLQKHDLPYDERYIWD